MHRPGTPELGVPARMAWALLRQFDQAGEDARRLAVIDDLLTDRDRVPLTAGEGAIFHKADKMAQECRAILASFNRCTNPEIIRLHMAAVFNRMGVPYPYPHDDSQAWARAVDQQFWVRALRKEFGRRFENTAIRLGFVGKHADPYITREGAARQAERNEENAKRLAQTEIICQDGPNAGQVITLAQAAAAGMANLANRRNELMTRIRGFEEIATELGHRGLFVTITAPSKFHAVGGHNDRYANFTPREAQAYLVGVWARIRAKLARLGIQPYGFRVAEPHTDGCPHWHLLLFVPRENMRQLRQVIRGYALAEDGDEAGAQKNRVKLVTMDAGKGTAAGYIAKYIAKNIDGKTAGGESMGDHRAHADQAGGLGDLSEVVDAYAYQGRQFLPAELVRYWAQKHAIRQFQQIGGAPVGVWRELRRIEQSALGDAPAVVQAAWQAVQKKDTGEKDEAGKAIYVQADWAAYVKAQGGPGCGRDAIIGLWKREVVIAGRYGETWTEKPCGIYAGSYQAASARYEWKPAAPAAVAFPWTGVNNCTGQAALKAMGGKFKPPAASEWTGRELKKFDPGVNWAGIEAKGEAKEAESKAFQGEAAPLDYGVRQAGEWRAWYVGPPEFAHVMWQHSLRGN